MAAPERVTSFRDSYGGDIHPQSDVLAKHLVRYPDLQTYNPPRNLTQTFLAAEIATTGNNPLYRTHPTGFELWLAAGNINPLDSRDFLVEEAEGVLRVMRMRYPGAQAEDLLVCGKPYFDPQLVAHLHGGFQAILAKLNADPRVGEAVFKMVGSCYPQTRPIRYEMHKDENGLTLLRKLSEPMNPPFGDILGTIDPTSGLNEVETTLWQVLEQFPYICDPVVQELARRELNKQPF